MTEDEFVEAAIKKGASGGLASLNADERFVYLISEAEMNCDMDGIDALLERYPPAELAECAAAFREIGASAIAAAFAKVVSALPARDQGLLDKLGSLITNRVGYDYEAIRQAVAHRLSRRL